VRVGEEAVSAATDDFFRRVTIAVRVAPDDETADVARLRARLCEVAAIAVLVVLLRLLLPILPPITVVVLTSRAGRSQDNYRAEWATWRKGWVKNG
jgi:hypothetical protein